MPTPAPTPETSALIEFWKTAAPAVIAVFGVFVGGLIQLMSTYVAANLQRRQRLDDDTAVRTREFQGLEAQRNYVRGVLARHLESFARACASVMWRNSDPEVDHAVKLPDMPAWPAIAWELLEADEMVEIRDIEVRVDILRDRTEGDVWHGAAHPDEERVYYARGAATIGLEAWRVAQRLRLDAGVSPFRFPAEGANFAEALKKQVEAIAARDRVA